MRMRLEILLSLKAINLSQRKTTIMKAILTEMLVVGRKWHGIGHRKTNSKW